MQVSHRIVAVCGKRACKGIVGVCRHKDPAVLSPSYSKQGVIIAAVAVAKLDHVAKRDPLGIGFCGVGSDALIVHKKIVKVFHP